MATKRVTIDGKTLSLSTGVRREKCPKSSRFPSGYRILAVWYDESRNRRREIFDYTEEGVKEATRLVNGIHEDIKANGKNFGILSEDEKMAVHIWRKYRDVCRQERCEYKTMQEVVKMSLRKLIETSLSPTMEEAAQLYMENMSQKNHGKVTPHAKTVENRLRHIVNALGSVRLCLISREQIIDFLNGLTHPQTKDGIKEGTYKQYLNLIKSVFRLMVKRGRLEEKQDITRTIDAPKIPRIEPETLSLDEVCKVFEYVRDNPKEHRFIPVLAVGFFCGSRLAERCRLNYKDIFVGGRDVVYLSCEITKNSRDRHTYTNANFRAWMDFAREHGVKMEANSYLLSGDTEEKRKDAHNRLLKRIAEATGVAFPKNCIRHTAATNMTELQGFTSTANQLGHGEGMLASNYRIAITRDEATAYFNISPTCCDADKLLSQAREQ